MENLLKNLKDFESKLEGEIKDCSLEQLNAASNLAAVKIAETREKAKKRSKINFKRPYTIPINRIEKEIKNMLCMREKDLQIIKLKIQLSAMENAMGANSNREVDDFLVSLHGHGEQSSSLHHSDPSNPASTSAANILAQEVSKNLNINK